MIKRFAIGAFVLGSMVAPLAQASAYGIIHSFDGSTTAQPEAGLVQDKLGNLWGTTSAGSATAGGCTNCGAVFELTEKGVYRVIHSFAGGSDGAVPTAALIQDAKGNLWGTTQYGGNSAGGTVFEISATGSYQVVHVFGIANDGKNPRSALMQDKQGNLWGTTQSGGDWNDGTVFKITASGSYEVVHSFSFANGDSINPLSSLLQDKDGNIWGTTSDAVFEISASGVYEIVHTFGGKGDGSKSVSALIQDKQGNIWGTTQLGGSRNKGTIFEIAANSLYQVVYSFTGGTDGAVPFAALFQDKQGNLWGTTAAGGSTGCYGSGCGTVFKLSPTGSYQIVYAFRGWTDGTFPEAPVIQDRHGRIVGTTLQGGKNLSGTIFRINP